MFEDLELDVVFSALADPTRRAMLARLAEGEATVSELAEPHGLAQPTISKHLRVLEEAGLIQQAAREATRRPRMLVVGGPLKDIDVWLEPFRKQWERRFDNLDSFLQAKQTKKQQTTQKKKRSKGAPR